MSVLQVSLQAALRAAAWLPAGASSLAAPGDGVCLLPAILEQWRDRMAETASNGRRSKLGSQAWLASQLAAGANLTLGPPALWKAAWPTLPTVAGRCCWWPQGLPGGPWSAIVSSRLGRRLDLRPEWFAAFRAACREVEADNALLLTGARSTCLPFARHAAERLGLALLILYPPRPGESLSSWFQRLRNAPSGPSFRNLYHAFLSPQVDPSQAGVADEQSVCPLVDQAVVAWADQLYVLHLRPSGNLEPLVRWRMAQARPACSPVFLAMGERLVPPAMAESWLRCGQAAALTVPNEGEATWRRPPHDVAVPSVAGNTPKNVRCAPSRSRRQWDADPSPRVWTFLTHCTRSPAGPWPDETREEYLDELLFGNCIQPRSPYAALERIVTQKRLLACGHGLRGGTPVVCFTEVPLADLANLRAFQPQRQRWDFEPYGICLPREWLIERGARPVIYGDDEVWNGLAAADRPFFQMRETRRCRHQQRWTREREWRHVGNVELDCLPSSAALLFVPTAAEAERLAAVSRWQVVVT